MAEITVQEKIECLQGILIESNNCGQTFRVAVLEWVIKDLQMRAPRPDLLPAPRIGAKA